LNESRSKEKNYRPKMRIPKGVSQREERKKEKAVAGATNMRGLSQRVGELKKRSTSANRKWATKKERARGAQQKQKEGEGKRISGETKNGLVLKSGCWRYAKSVRGLTATQNRKKSKAVFSFASMSSGQKRKQRDGALI